MKRRKTFSLEETGERRILVVGVRTARFVGRVSGERTAT